MQLILIPSIFAFVIFGLEPSNSNCACTCQPDSDWWKIETPPPTPGEHDGEEGEGEEDEERDSGFDSDEGELDSVGFLFHALIENNISVELCSRFVSYF